MCGGAFERVVDLVEMPLRVLFGNWVPNDFFAEDAFAVHDGSHFAVTAAEVKTDAATIEMTAERGGRFFGWRNIFRTDDSEGLFVNAASHDLSVEAAGESALVMLHQFVMNFRGT